MRFIPTTVHGLLDYSTGLLIAVPWQLGIADGGAETWMPVSLGVGAILYSLLTDYELGAVRLPAMPMHLGLDAASGALLAASPWLFGFADRVWMPHLLLGLFEIAAALTTQTHPRHAERPAHAAGTR